MTWTLALLALLATIVVGAGLRSALRPDGLEINHVGLFSFGLFFYWIVPIASGSFRGISDEPALRLWYATWDVAERSGGLRDFLLVAYAGYLAFLAGDRLGARLRVRRTAAYTPYRDPRLLRLALPLALALLAAYAWSLRGELFTGYATVYEAGSGRGTITAVSLLLLVLCMLRWAEVERWPRARPGQVGVLLDPFVLAYLLSALLLLSLGARLYVASAALIALVYSSVYRHPMPAMRTALIVVAGAIGAGAMGSLRLGYVPTAPQVAINVLSEPLFTGFSLLHFIGHEQVPLLAWPQFLLSDFLNLVPTAVFPSKGEFILDPEDFGYTIYSPLGAMNSFVSFAINFGLLGTPLVLFALGVGLAVLKRSSAVHLRVSYCMLCGCLAFTFFRDAFSISVVKNMFQFSLLMPCLVAWGTHALTVIAPRGGGSRGPASAITR